MKKIILPSIIANSQKELDERINNVKNSSGTFHLDVMDGKFVKNKSLMFDFKVLKGKKYQAHLMVNNPLSWINKNWKKVDVIIFHPEPFKDNKKILEIVDLIKSKRRKVGLAINPKTSIEKIRPYLGYIDLVLIMTVNPGKYGGKFLPQTLKKIKQFRMINPRLNIGVDGGINDKTIKKVSNSGANIFVSGSYIQKKDNPKKTIKLLMNLVK